MPALSSGPLYRRLSEKAGADIIECNFSCPQMTAKGTGSDVGHQAISFGEDRIPRIIGQKCVGCHLCMLVCTTGAISAGNRIPKPQNC